MMGNNKNLERSNKKSREVKSWEIEENRAYKFDFSQSYCLSTLFYHSITWEQKEESGANQNWLVYLV